eukprot:TRINITY_DN44596_c0_g1_i1.p1 TRINITY_DN44596_c0_g1~~TRINITY_DN44596_c0_g1_i1.p1  ORF type:complete len:220 (+),score=30.68 TRINITY_DN44596_c0_g1_i1:177-836(+)
MCIRDSNCTTPDDQCRFGCVNNSGVEIDEMGAYDDVLRMMIVNPWGSTGFSHPQPEMSWTTRWLAPSQMAGEFSAVCYFFGRDLARALTPPRPLGLIETAVGGTPDQHWSSPDAIQQCKGSHSWNWPSNFSDSVLWNGFVVPLLRTSITGVIWYQGEGNAGADGRQYNCSFQAMIRDWRAKFHEHTDGATAMDFPVGRVQLNSNGKAAGNDNPHHNISG